MQRMIVRLSVFLVMLYERVWLVGIHLPVNELECLNGNVLLKSASESQFQCNKYWFSGYQISRN